MVGWKAYLLKNGEIKEYTSDNTKWEDVPQEGFMWLKQFWHYPDRTQNAHLTENITGQDLVVLDNCMLNELKPDMPKIVKFGELQPNDVWNNIVKHIKADEEIVKVMI